MQPCAIKRPSLILVAIFPSIALGLLNGLYLPQLAHESARLYWTADIAQWVLVPALSFWLLVKLGGVRPTEFGFGSLARGDSPFGILGLIAVVTFLYWVAYDPVKAIAYGFFSSTAEPNPFIHALPNAQPWRWLLVFYASLTAAVVEEPVFRSLPWLYFTTYWSAPEIPYILSTSVVFAAIHWEQGIPGLLAAGSLGVVAAALYTKIRNVWPFIAAHFFAGVWSYPWL